jgi:hypothetical protein
MRTEFCSPETYSYKLREHNPKKRQHPEFSGGNAAAIYSAYYWNDLYYFCAGRPWKTQHKSLKDGRILSQQTTVSLNFSLDKEHLVFPSLH